MFKAFATFLNIFAQYVYIFAILNILNVFRTCATFLKEESIQNYLKTFKSVQKLSKNIKNVQKGFLIVWICSKIYNKVKKGLAM